MPDLHPTIQNYRDLRKKMEQRIDEAISAVFTEFYEEYGTAPAEIDLGVLQVEHLGELPRNIYMGCTVSLGGDE